MKSSASLLFILMVIFSAGFMSCTKTNFPAPDMNGDYSVFAWNDLEMHCINPSYDKLVILPPYNNVMAQVVKRGNPPELVTEGITVNYRIIDNTTSYNKRLYGGFWDFSNKLFGVTLVHDIGLKGNGLSGNPVLHHQALVALH